MKSMQCKYLYNDPRRYIQINKRHCVYIHETSDETSNFSWNRYFRRYDGISSCVYIQRFKHCVSTAFQTAIALPSNIQFACDRQNFYTVAHEAKPHIESKHITFMMRSWRSFRFIKRHWVAIEKFPNRSPWIRTASIRSHRNIIRFIIGRCTATAPALIIAT